MSNDTELAWAAGFWDGEGNFNATLPKGNKAYILQAKVTQIHRDTLERFQAAVGLGKIYGPYSTKSGVHPQFTLSIRGPAAVRALAETLWPYLCPHKQRQFSDAWTTWESTRPVVMTPEQRAERRRQQSRDWARRNYIPKAQRTS